VMRRMLEAGGLNGVKNYVRKELLIATNDLQIDINEYFNDNDSDV